MSQSNAARVPTRPVARPVGRERPQPRLRVVAPTPRRSAGGLALLSVGLLVLGLLVLLLLNISIGKGAYALTELQRQQRLLAEDRQSLAEQVEAASAPDVLAARADKLGMVPAPNYGYVNQDGTTAGEPEVALPAPKSRAKSTRTAKTAVGAAAAVAAAGKKVQQSQRTTTPESADDTIDGSTTAKPASELTPAETP